MQQDFKTRLRIAALIYGMTNAVLFGIGLILVLNLPGLRAHAGMSIAVVVALSLLLAAPVAWLIAPRLRARFSQRKAERALAAPPMPPSSPKRLHSA